MNKKKLALDGVTIIDITQVVAGPHASMMLGDLGAKVIKVENVDRGDRARSISQEYFDMVNRNKESIGVDLRTEEGQNIIYKLVKEADILIENMKPGRPNKFNINYNKIQNINKNIIYCSIRGFGRNSPYEMLPAWDMLIQAMSGVMSVTGTENSPPIWSALPSGDLAASSYATQSILAALYAREKGIIEGEWIEVPMLDAVISWLSIRISHTVRTGEPYPRTGTWHPWMAPFGVFKCNDGEIVIAAGTDSLWKDFCGAIGRDDLLSDSRFSSMNDRLDNRDALREELENTLSENTKSYWVDKLQNHQVPAGPINDTKTLLDDAYVKQRELIKTMPRENEQNARVVNTPVHFSELISELRSSPDSLGGSTNKILKEMGFSINDIEELKDRNIIK